VVLLELVEAPYYKAEGCGFDFRWCNRIFHCISFRPHYGPGVDSGSNRNEYQKCFIGGKGGRCVRLTNLSTSCNDRLEIREPQPPRTLWVCPGLLRYCFNFPWYLAVYCVVRTITMLRRWWTQHTVVYSHTEMLPHCITIPLEFKCLHCKCWIKKQSELLYLLLAKV
jgi:hypothetical protein